jgi:hypothetical protein
VPNPTACLAPQLTAIGHFGAELKRFVISQYVQGQVTVPRLASLLNDIGIVCRRSRPRKTDGGMCIYFDTFCFVASWMLAMPSNVALPSELSSAIPPHALNLAVERSVPGARARGAGRRKTEA